MMHPIDQALAEMQARRRARTWPPVTLDEFAELNEEQLARLVQEWSIETGQVGKSRRAIIVALYRSVHELDQKVLLYRR